MCEGSVGIVGAGISGLVVAWYLRPQGVEPTLFESHTALGGVKSREVV